MGRTVAVYQWLRGVGHGRPTVEGQTLIGPLKDPPTSVAEPAAQY